MRVTVGRAYPDGDPDDMCTVDIQDTESHLSPSQALVYGAIAADPLTLMADMQVRDCVRSVWMSATTVWDNGHIAKTGEHLPAGFPIEVQTPAKWDRASITPSPDDGRCE